MKKLQPLLVF